jgi:hypothetical protein
MGSGRWEMRKKAVRVGLVVGMVVGLLTTAIPAHADPCDVDNKYVHIDLIDCG